MVESTHKQEQTAPSVSVVTPLIQAAPTGASEPAAAPVLPPEHFQTELEDAERLIKHAADVGVDVGDDVRQKVLSARIAANGGWTDQHSVNLLSALTTLSAKLNPVSGESLRACVYSVRASRTIRAYRRVAIVLAVFIIPLSFAAFIATATCEAIRKDTETANALAVTLTHELPAASTTGQAAKPTPKGAQQYSEKEIKDLQQFAATIRAISDRATQLERFAAYAVPDVYDTMSGKSPEELRALFELPRGLPDMPKAAADKIELYKDVRRFAQSVQEAVSTIFGALTACILPTLYALLGACAYLILTFEREVRARSFTGVDKPTARFLIAGIGGLVVGLFGNFSAGASLPPLAIAFLVGYAADVFFSFLDGLLKAFGRPQDSKPIPNSAALVQTDMSKSRP